MWVVPERTRQDNHRYVSGTENLNLNLMDLGAAPCIIGRYDHIQFKMCIN